MHSTVGRRAARRFETLTQLLACAAAGPMLLAAAPGLGAEPKAASANAAATDATAEADGGALEAVIVTAERRETNLQKTPISISVLTSSDLESRHVQSLQDFATGGAPGLRVTPFASRPFSLILNIRGVGVMIDTNQPARDPGVGVYIDGVYLGRPQGLNAALYDVQSIEVLKGPQGTLFGRNTEGGALNITTRKPTGQFHLDVIGGLGNLGSYETVLHLDLPEYNNIRVKLDGIITARDGTVDNPLPGAADFGAFERRGVHAQVQWRPLDTFVATYTYDRSRDEAATLYTNLVSAGSNRLAPLLPAQPRRVRTAVIGIPLQPSIGRQWGHALNLTWSVTPDLTLKSITSYRDLYQNQFQNSVAAAVFTPNAQFGRYSLAAFDQYQYSQEFQAIGGFGEQIKYVAGALAYHEHVDDMAQTFNSLQLNAAGTDATVLPRGANVTPTPIDIAALVPFAPIDRASRVSADSYGLYGQATWTPPVMDGILHVTGGLRWTKDRKKGELYVINNALPVNQFGKSVILGFKKSWSRVDPLITLAADVAPDAQVYGKWSTGYKSGGANSRSLSYGAFNPEKISMFEIGAKTEFFDHRARVNVAAYTGAYKDFQVDFSAPYFSYDANGNIITSASTTRTTTETINVPNRARVKGVETELTVVPLEGLTLSGSYTYAYIRIPPTINPFPTFVPGVGTVVATTPTRIYQEFTPKHAVTASIDYALPLDRFTLRAHLDGSYDSGSYGTDRDPAPTVRAIRSQQAVVFNGRLSIADIELPNGARLSLSAWGRNLFDEQHLYTRNISPTTGVSGNYNERRTFGLEGKVAL